MLQLGKRVLVIYQQFFFAFAIAKPGNNNQLQQNRVGIGWQQLVVSLTGYFDFSGDC